MSTLTVEPEAPHGRPQDIPTRRRREGIIRGAGSRMLGLLLAVGALAVLVVLSIAVGSKPIPLGTVLRCAARTTTRRSTTTSSSASLRVPRTERRVARRRRARPGRRRDAGRGAQPARRPGHPRRRRGRRAVRGRDRHLRLRHRSLLGYVWFAFAGAAVASVVVYGLGSLGREGATPVKLALAGAAIARCWARSPSAILLLDVATLDQFRFWAVGSLAGRDADDRGAAGAVHHRRRGAGARLRPDAQRAGAGRRRRPLARAARRAGARAVARRRSSCCSAARRPRPPVRSRSSGSTVPHVARVITGPDYRWVLPYSAVLAPILLLGSDIVGRVVARPGELQVGIVTAVIGAPVLRRARPSAQAGRAL